MKLLMSIKPKYWAKIVSGEKLIEFRRMVPKDLRPDVFYPVHQGKRTVVVYASAPTKKVVGELEINGVISQGMWNWHNICDRAGISFEEFIAYCGGDDKNVWGLSIGKVTVYDEPKTLQEAYPYIERPPQNFCYIRKENYMKAERVQKAIDTIDGEIAEVERLCEGEGPYTQHNVSECKSWANHLAQRLSLLKKHFENKEKL
ncbi:MAG: hypothetical protein LUC16_02155 [Coprobacillus sp.]|nr:hypothetical protein [Coprobacillus sp.]